jgi:hypothetical protein
MLVTRKNILTGKLNQMEIDITKEQLDQMDNSNDAAFRNEIRKNLSLTEREFLISGMSLEEQEQMFGRLSFNNDEENDDEDEDDEGIYGIIYPDDYNGPTGHGDICYSDADPGL